MSEVTIRDLRNRGSEVIDRALAGESLTVTRDGRSVAELRPIGRPKLAARTLLARWGDLPAVNPDELRRDLYDLVDPSL